MPKVGKSDKQLTSVKVDPKLFEGHIPWNDNNSLWTPSFDVWGHYDDENGIKRPIKLISPVYIEKK